MLKIILIFIAIFSATPALAQWRLLEAKEVYVDTYKNETVHDPYLAPDDQYLTYGASFNTNFDILKYNGYGLYMDNDLHFDQDSQDGQVRAAGWQYNLGLVVWQKDGKNKIELFKQHHSQHVLDRTREDLHFPVYDRVGVRWNLYQRDLK